LRRGDRQREAEVVLRHARLDGAQGSTGRRPQGQAAARLVLSLKDIFDNRRHATEYGSPIYPVIARRPTPRWSR